MVDGYRVNILCLSNGDVLYLSITLTMHIQSSLVHHGGDFVKICYICCDLCTTTFHWHVKQHFPSLKCHSPTC
jgi:hypothetical protein